jgi:hypothetical protein
MYYDFKWQENNLNKMLNFISELTFQVGELEINIIDIDNLSLNQNLQELHRIIEQINYFYHHIINN